MKTARIEDKPKLHIKMPDIGDIAPGGVVGACIADIERMLADQGLEPTARNWIAVCDHFRSLSLISGARALAFRLLRQAIERDALSAVMIAATPTALTLQEAVTGAEPQMSWETSK